MTPPGVRAATRGRGRPVAPVALVDHQRRVLQRWACSRTTAELGIRATLLLACAEGASNQEAAALVGVSARVAGSWRRRFASEGLRGLLDRPRPGAPARIDERAVEVAVELGASSSRQLARAGGFSQSSAQRLKGVLAARSRGSELVGLYAQGQDRCLALSPADPASPSPQAPRLSLAACWTALVEAERRVRALAALLPPGSGTVRLRRFLKQLHRRLGRGERASEPIDLVVVGDSFRTRAVQRWLRKHDRYAVHDVATQAWFRRLLQESLHRVPLQWSDLAEVATAYDRRAEPEAQPLSWLAR